MENPPPVRAPYDENEGYKPLRKPKSAANTPTHSVGLSPDAVEFTPSNASNSFQTDRLQHQQRYQQQHNQQNYSQFHQNKPYHHQQHHGHHHNQQFQQHQQPHHHTQHHQQHHQHHQHHYNGYQQMSQHQNPQQHQHQQQQQQQQQYYSPMSSSSVQGRLNVNRNANAENSSPYSSSSTSTSKNTGTSNSYNNYNQHQRTHHHQQHHNHHHHQSYQNSGSGAAAAAPHQTSAVEVETIALDYLQTVIQCLNQNPGQFDSIATRFLTIFDGMENNDYVLSNAMEDIFQESIQKPNFRYMGAKLYNLLHMLNLKKDSLFHMLLKCKLDYHQNELVQYMKQPNQQQMVRETALFLAELYMQLRGDDSRIHLIAENIVFALKQLLSKESNDNVRCICLTLKLAGYDLTSDCPNEMLEIIQQLDSINCKNPGKYPLAANVISLQKNNWGRKISSSNSMCEDEEKLRQPEPLRTSDEPIFYGPDGRELTAEESDFLTSHVGTGADSGVAGAGGGSTDEEDVPDLDVDLDPEMDEETEKAYKEFCKLKPSS